MCATLTVSWVCLPPELEKSSIASPVCSSLGNESFSLFYVVVIIIINHFPSIMCGVFDVEMEHGLFPPHRPHSEGACLLPGPEGQGVPCQFHPLTAPCSPPGFSPSPCLKLGWTCQWWWLWKKSPGLCFLGCLLHDACFLSVVLWLVVPLLSCEKGSVLWEKEARRASLPLAKLLIFHGSSCASPSSFLIAGKSHLIHFHVSTISEKVGKISIAAVFSRN